MKASKPAPEQGSLALLRRLFSEYGRPHLRAYVAGALLMGVGAAATSYSAWLLSPIVNGMVGAGGFKELRTLSWVVFGLFALRGLVTFGSLALLSRAGNRVVATIQRELFDALLRQDMRFFHDRHSAEFMTRLSLSANGMRDAMQQTITSTSRDALTAIGLVAVMIGRDPMLALIALAGLPVAAATLGRLIGKIRKFARRSFDGSTRIVETLQEAVLGARIVKSFNLEDVMRGRMGAAIREVERSANRMAITAAISNPVSDVLAGFAIGAVIFYGSWRVTIQHADPGSLFSFIAALMLAYEPLKRLGRSNLDIQNGLMGARMIYEVLDGPGVEAAAPGLPKLDVSGGGRIVLEGVRFGYRPDEPVLLGVDLVAEPNTTTALVGPSGGGKSTIIGLIQRFYSPDAGRVLIDGQDVMNVDLHSLRASIAFVSQDVFLFRGTIRDNIALGRAGATEEEIVAAAIKAHAHDFIIGFGEGYATNIGEQGAQLSGGQRARIAIARAILKDAPILLLDEPTAALDSESEREIQKALDDLRVGRSTVVVAHRLQTIINADRICVIDGGRVAESGVHADLIARYGVYRAFFSMQFGEPANGELVMRAHP
jgi:ATP-binding cassette subfamily B protein